MRNLKNQWGDRNPYMNKPRTDWTANGQPFLVVAFCLIIAIMGCSL